MKKIPIMIGVLALALTLSACGTKNDSENLNGTDSYGATDNTGASGDNLAEAPVVPITEATNTINQTEPVSDIATSSAITKTMTRTLDGQTDLFKDYSAAIIKTNEGNIEVKFYPESPITVNNFMNLAKSGFYNDTKFHRVIKDFMIQGGDPLSKGTDTSVYGTGGPAYRFADEFNSHKLVAGSLAMANSGPGTNGSQFFIVTATETPWLDGVHTNFGEVVKGMDIVQTIGNTETGARDLPTKDIVVKNIELVK
ncbi:MAG: peptidylprolyl isomerase [Candidatus Falkowbacteria bacterium]